MKNKKRNLLVAFAAFLIFTGGYFLGYERSLPTGGLLPEIQNRLKGRSGIDFDIFWKSWDLINDKYDGELDHQKMLYGAINGMVQSISDPYTAFMNPDEAKSFEEELSGKISGIGAEIGMKKGNITVIAPLDGSPAERAGLKAGDIILKIDDKSTEGLSVNEAVSRIRGSAGTEVRLSILKGKDTRDYVIKREEITLKSVSYEIENDILKIGISRFDEKTVTLLRQAETEGIERNIKSIILDLRNNPGGYVDSAIDVASEFINNQVIVSERTEKNNKIQEYRSSKNGLMTDTAKYPLIVLINEGSASAAEIVSGAIQDHARGQLVGEKTFGKGSVQEIKKLSDGSELKITVSHWYTPNGKNISKEGLAPDIQVILSDEDYDNDRDPQLKKAQELLRAQG